MKPHLIEWMYEMLLHIFSQNDSIHVCVYVNVLIYSQDNGYIFQFHFLYLKHVILNILLQLLCEYVQKFL